MSIVLVNKNGTSNAKAGDIVVTGGGLFKKNADGSSSFVGGLDTQSGKSGNYADVVNKFTSMIGNNGNNNSAPAVSGTTTVPIVKSDTNGVIELAADPLFDPNEYTTGGNPIYGTSNTTPTSTATSGMNNILGYVIVGLVSIALLDRFMNPVKK